MKTLYRFLVRLVLSVLLAFIIIHFFFPGKSMLGVLSLAGIMLALAYLFQYTRKRDRGEKDET